MNPQKEQLLIPEEAIRSFAHSMIENDFETNFLRVEYGLNAPSFSFIFREVTTPASIDLKEVEEIKDHINAFILQHFSSLKKVKLFTAISFEHGEIIVFFVLENCQTQYSELSKYFQSKDCKWEHKEISSVSHITIPMELLPSNTSVHQANYFLRVVGQELFCVNPTHFNITAISEVAGETRIDFEKI